ncbi:head-tail connector protein, partial [Stenotrophomonas maltophilia]|uniref:head-tail connector protein n=1 Tax=Stenotrophomonas maltophilia TaxID=40324 RepID=UPI002250F46E|nr:head-tail connector protein [Stenotrophomonas maltophilia]
DNDDSYEDAMFQAYIEASLAVCPFHFSNPFFSFLFFSPSLPISCLIYVSPLFPSRTMISDVEAKEIPLAISALWSVYRDVGVY